MNILRKRIEQLAENLIRRFRSDDPFVIAEAKNIIILYEPLGTIRGYYGSSYRFRVIHINQDMEPWEKRFTCAHELGHALLHPNVNTPFLRENTFLSINKLEREANLFAACLLCPLEKLEEYREYTVSQIASLTGVREELIRLRVGDF